ncbi:hypothetical protein [Pseudocitrobacter vendiensis]|uniref:Replication protein n=1 Tax=Pseudocitrobacter vendiensis TaxID=2488306 RepID=A0ABM9FAK0_9ENTR|nr:hypothetical protein [Pseudocitrobacter vendiensis]CAH6659901.1 hypothetical protein FBBNIHIM_12310 [Pseudocitrobacter vendiensis]
MSKPKTDTYDVVYSCIRRITKLRTVEGEIRFTGTMKLIYAYIWTFQENKKRGNDDPIHTNTNVIAWEVGVSEKAAIEALKALDTAKVVRKATVKVRGNVNSSNYVAIPPASVAVRGVTPPHPNEVKPKPKKKAAPANEENKGDEDQAQQQEHEQKPVTDGPETAAPAAGKPDGVPAVDIPVDVELSGGDDAVNASTQYTDEQLRTKFRKWRNLGLDEEAKASCLSHSVSNDEDSMKLFIQNYHIPVPEPVKQQVNVQANEPPLDFDDTIPF